MTVLCEISISQTAAACKVFAAKIAAASFVQLAVIYLSHQLPFCIMLQK